MDKLSILWTDDEIDLLKPHILFLQEKFMELITGEDISKGALEENVNQRGVSLWHMI